MLDPGSITLNPVFRVSPRGTAQFGVTIPNVLPGPYRLSLTRNGRTLARAPRPLTVVDGPPGVRDCKSEILGQLPDDWENRAIRAGPIAFLLSGVSAAWVTYYKQVKVIAVVESEAVVTVRVADPERRNVALHYAARGKLGWEGKRVADGLPAVTFEACPSEGWRPYTLFSGGFVVDGPQCAHLAVLARGRPEPIPVAIPLRAPC